MSEFVSPKHRKLRSTFENIERLFAQMERLSCEQRALSLAEDLDTQEAVRGFFRDIPIAIKEAKQIEPGLTPQDLGPLETAVNFVGPGMGRLQRDILLSQPLHADDFNFALKFFDVTNVRPGLSSPPPPPPPLEATRLRSDEPVKKHQQPVGRVKALFRNPVVVSAIITAVVGPLLVASYVAHSGPPTKARFSYTGRVVDDGGQPISEAQVTFVVDGNAPLVALTDSHGFFHLSLPSGGTSFTAAVDAPGYKRETSNAEPRSDGGYVQFVLHKFSPPTGSKTPARKRAPHAGTLGQTNEKNTARNDVRIVVTDERGIPIRGVEVLPIESNGTHLKLASTDDTGSAEVSESLSEKATIYCARPDFHHYFSASVDLRGVIKIRMEHMDRGGSAIFVNGTGYIPVLDGRLNPIRDSLDRTYLYAENIAIDGGKAQPVPFTTSQPLQLIDSHGKSVEVEIVSILGASSLIEYRRND